MSSNALLYKRDARAPAHQRDVADTWCWDGSLLLFLTGWDVACGDGDVMVNNHHDV